MSSPPTDFKLGSPDQTESSDTIASPPTGHTSVCQVTSSSENCTAAASASQTSFSVGSQAVSIPESELACGTKVTSAIHSVAKSKSCANLSDKEVEEKEEWTGLSEEEKELSLALLQSSDTPSGHPTGCISVYQSTSTSENCSTAKFTSQTSISCDATAVLDPHNGAILGGPNITSSPNPPTSQPIGLDFGTPATLASHVGSCAIYTSPTIKAVSIPESELACRTKVTSAICSVAKSTSCANLSDKEVEEKEEWTGLSEEEKELSLALLQSSDLSGQPTGCISVYRSTSTSRNYSTAKFTSQTIISCDATAALDPHNSAILGGPNITSSPNPPTSQLIGLDFGTPATSSSQVCSSAISTLPTIFDTVATSASHSGIILGAPNRIKSSNPPISQPLGLVSQTQAISASQICSTAILPQTSLSTDTLAVSVPCSGIMLGGPRSSDPPTNQQVELDYGTLATATSVSHICSIAASSPQTIISSGIEQTSSTETGHVSRTLAVFIPCTSISAASTVQSKLGMQSTSDLSGLRDESLMPSSQYSLTFGASLVTARSAPSDVAFRSPSSFSFGSPPATSKPASSCLPTAIGLTSSITFGSSGPGSPAGFSTIGSLSATGRPQTNAQPTFSDTSSSSPFGFGTFTTISSTGLSEPIETGSTAVGFRTSSGPSLGCQPSKFESAPVATLASGFGAGFKFLPFTSTTTTASARGTSLGLSGLISQGTITQPSTGTSLFPSSTGIETKVAITTTTGTFDGFGTSSYGTGFGTNTPITTTTGAFAGFSSTSLETGFGIKAPTTSTSGTFCGSGTASFGAASGSTFPVLGSSNQQSVGWNSKPYLGVVSTTAVPVFSFRTTTSSNSLGASTQSKSRKASGKHTTIPRSSDQQSKGSSFSKPAKLGAVSTTTPSGFSFGATTTSNSLVAGRLQNPLKASGSVRFSSGLRVVSTTTGSVFSLSTTATTMSNPGGASRQQKRAEGFHSNTTTQIMGTPIKFNPVTGTDEILLMGGLTVNTRLYCITCMKEYEAKSLEELRLEDYMLKRVGPQQSGLFISCIQPYPFGSAASITTGGGSSFFRDKPLFGAGTTMGFGSETGVPGSSNQQSKSLFGKPAGFKAVTTTTGTGFSFNTTTTTSNPFDANMQPKPFGGFKATSSKNVETDPVQVLSDAEMSKIWSILECPVCFDVVLPPVYQCERGHHACNSCWKNMSSCPLCKSCKSMASRNFVAEAIVELVKLPCRFRGDGCKSAVLLTKKQEHEEFCPHHTFECPISYCRDKQNYQTVSGHLSQKHGLLVTEVTDHPEMLPEFSKTIEIKKFSSLIHGFLISGWGLFLLCSKTTESKTLLWMQMLSAPGKSSTFTYKIDVVDHLSRHGVSYAGSVLLLKKTIDAIQEEYCLHITDIMLKSLRINCLKITVHITK